MTACVRVCVRVSGQIETDLDDEEVDDDDLAELKELEDVVS